MCQILSIFETEREEFRTFYGFQLIQVQINQITLKVKIKSSPKYWQRFLHFFEENI